MEKNNSILIRISEEEKYKWQAHCKILGMTLSEFIRRVVNQTIDFSTK